MKIGNFPHSADTWPYFIFPLALSICPFVLGLKHTLGGAGDDKVHNASIIESDIEGCSCMSVFYAVALHK